jgi:protein-tyrosine-phosphatase
MPAVLFVCTGNICRSPMAVGLFKRLIRPEKNRTEWRIESTGTWAVEGMPPSQNGQIALQAMGLDISGHRSQPLTGELLEEFDLILTMEAGHKEAIQVEFPQVAGRVYMLSEVVGERRDIADPIGGPLEEYEETARELDLLLKQGFNRILQLTQKKNDH